MWEAIGYVSSGLTLAAFSIAVVAWLYRKTLLQRERLIRQASESDRANLVEQALEFFQVDTAGLSRQQRYALALRQIDARAVRFRTTAFVVVIIAFLTAGIAIFALLRQTSGENIAVANPTSTPTSAPSSSIPTPAQTVAAADQLTPTRLEERSASGSRKSEFKPSEPENSQSNQRVEPNPTGAIRPSWSLIEEWITKSLPSRTNIDHIKKVDDPGCRDGCQKATVVLKDSGGKNTFQHVTVTYHFAARQWRWHVQK